VPASARKPRELLPRGENHAQRRAHYRMSVDPRCRSMRGACVGARMTRVVRVLPVPAAKILALLLAALDRAESANARPATQKAVARRHAPYATHYAACCQRHATSPVHIQPARADPAARRPGEHRAAQESASIPFTSCACVGRCRECRLRQDTEAAAACNRMQITPASANNSAKPACRRRYRYPGLSQHRNVHHGE